MASTLARVASDTPGRPLSAKDTALLVTPARRAMSTIVGRFTATPSPRAAVVDCRLILERAATAGNRGLTVRTRPGSRVPGPPAAASGRPGG
ncbi:hypothetical protein GCM10010420_33500 [Streptomyces glaucosporus]|uniref:Uncharacterized protein n=1 Tax=Streptomyces glaucosporus TaxID=284044 RepID=A0ABN3IFM2_9ACTN